MTLAQDRDVAFTTFLTTFRLGPKRCDFRTFRKSVESAEMGSVILIETFGISILYPARSNVPESGSLQNPENIALKIKSFSHGEFNIKELNINYVKTDRNEPFIKFAEKISYKRDKRSYWFNIKKIKNIVKNYEKFIKTKIN